MLPYIKQQLSLTEQNPGEHRHIIRLLAYLLSLYAYLICFFIPPFCFQKLQLIRQYTNIELTLLRQIALLAFLGLTQFKSDAD